MPVLHTPPRSVNGRHAALESLWHVESWGRQPSTAASSKLNIGREKMMSNSTTPDGRATIVRFGTAYQIGAVDGGKLARMANQSGRLKRFGNQFRRLSSS